MRKSLFIILCSAALTVTVIFMALTSFSRALPSVEELSEFSSMPADTVVERAIKLIYANEPDSALPYLSLVAQHYNPDMKREDQIACAKAFNALGYVYFFHFKDLPRGLNNFLQAEQIEKDNNDSTILASVHLNMANVLTYQSDINLVMKYLRRAADEAVAAGNWNMYLKAFYNVVFQGIMEYDPAEIVPDMNRFASLKLPQVSTSAFATELYHGSQSLINKNYEAAYACFDRAKDCVNGEEDESASLQNAVALYLKAQTLRLKGDQRGAIALVEAEITGRPSEQRAGLHLYLSNLFQDLGDTQASARERLKYYNLADSTGILVSEKSIAEVYSTFNVERLTQQVKQMNQARNRHIVIIVSCILALLILGGMLTYVIISRRKLLKSQEQLYRKNEELREAITPISERIAITSCRSTRDRANGPSGDDPEKTLPEQMRVEAADIMARLAGMDEVFSSDFTIERAAQMLGIHSRHLSKLLNAVYGTNFSQVMQRLRVNEACRRLQTQDPKTAAYNMSGIAADLGFKSRTYFSEVFKKQTGMTFTEYVRTMQRVHLQPDI